MSIRNLDALFKPRSIAVIGASNRPGTVGHALWQNVGSAELTGGVYPINLKYDAVQGARAYRRLADLPQAVDLAIVAIPAATVPAVIEEIGAAGTRAAVIISAGFRETGAAGRELEAELERARTKFDGLRILGPNCLGFLVPKLQLNASFARGLPKPGRIALVSQSGALGTAVVDWAQSADVGFSYFVSLGNMLDVGFADVIDYLADDDQTDALILYVEAITHARDFMSAARAFTHRKPIVVHKAGRYAAGAQAATSHTGALAGTDAAYEAAFRRAAMVRVKDSEQLFGCAELLARCGPPRGPRLAIVTNAGGPAVMAVDVLGEGFGQLAALSDATVGRLDERLPKGWSRRNPVDVLGDATPERLAGAAATVLEDDSVDAVLVILTPQAMTDPTETARQVAAVVTQQRKLTLATWMGGQSVAEGRTIFHRSGIPTFNTPEEAIRAFSHLVSYGRGLELLYQAPQAAPAPLLLSQSERRERSQALLHSAETLLSEPAAKAVLDLYEIPNTRPRVAHAVDEAEQAACEIGFPLVMKVLSPDITHKSDVGGVRTNLQSVDDVRRAYEDTLRSVGDKQPTARVDGVTLQRYVTALYSAEMILGCRRDPIFGPVIMVGFGGIVTELLHDCTFELPPLDEHLARSMLERLRSYPVLTGFRGRPALAVDRLIESMLRFSSLVAECPEIVECDVNPLVVTADDVVALDARMAVDPSVTRCMESLYAHLALAPYPEQYVRSATLKDGTPVVLRPLRPEDESLWHRMVDAASDQTILFRFRSIFRSVIHTQAVRYCFIDYDREMAFVAETVVDGRPTLVGVARLVADRSLARAELGIVVVDTWQARGVGNLLFDACLDYAKRTGLKEIYAETGWDNRRMLGMFRSRGFALHHYDNDPTTILAKRRISGEPT